MLIIASYINTDIKKEIMSLFDTNEKFYDLIFSKRPQFKIVDEVIKTKEKYLSKSGHKARIYQGKKNIYVVFSDGSAKIF